MAELKEARVPDIGGHDDVPVIEVLVKPGDRIEKDQGLVTLESDKATMEVPAPFAGIVREVRVKVGDTVSEGALVAMVEADDAGVPMNAVMIATFFLVGMDTGHRVISWFEQQHIDWSRAMALIIGRQGRPTAGVTWSSNAVAAMLLGASGQQLGLDRLYIAPHAPMFNLSQPPDAQALAAQEAGMRNLWNYTRSISDLGDIMYHGYPRFSQGRPQRPVLTPETQWVSELPAIQGPDDWRAFNTRLRVILEDPRQLLASCVTDYTVQCLMDCGNQPDRLTVPGLDGMPYPIVHS